MLQLSAEILDHQRIAEATFRIRLHCPDVAGRIRPGQFVMLRIPGVTDPLLGRPFALYDTFLDGGDPIGIEIVYLVVGKMTGAMSTLRPGERLEVWGPLGNGFPDLSGAESVILVAGGIGQTPFLAHIRQLLGSRGYGGDPAQTQTARVEIFYGVRSVGYLAGVEDFRAAGAEVHLATDDGSFGFRGRVTDLLRERRPTGVFVGCGPEPMLHALAKLTEEWKARCYVSLETPMACGFGVCFSCVTKVKAPDGGWDYQRVCIDGPIFDAAKLVHD